jgi:hypothetical protein
MEAVLDPEKDQIVSEDAEVEVIVTTSTLTRETGWTQASCIVVSNDSVVSVYRISSGDASCEDDTSSWHGPYPPATPAVSPEKGPYP